MSTPEVSYFFGFAQADGHLEDGAGNKGRFRIEISAEDKCILEAFAKIIPAYTSITERTRDTNFKKASRLAALAAYDLAFRDRLKSLGFPAGRKSNIVSMPAEAIEKDYLRGFVDADGSVGLTRASIPFISLCTSSEYIKDSFLAYTNKLTGRIRRPGRNKRDNIYNICVFLEDAQLLIKDLYYEGALALPRKAASARSALAWSREPGTTRRFKMAWIRAEDATVLANNNAKAAELLNRTVRSVKMRRWRLNA